MIDVTDDAIDDTDDTDDTDGGVVRFIETSQCGLAPPYA